MTRSSSTASASSRTSPVAGREGTDVAAQTPRERPRGDVQAPSLRLSNIVSIRSRVATSTDGSVHRQTHAKKPT